MWSAFSDAGWPVSFHILTGAGGGDPTLGSRLGMLTVMSVVQQVQQTLALLIFGRVFDRNPGLKVVSAEHDAGWVAHYASVRASASTMASSASVSPSALGTRTRCSLGSRPRR